jgi:hypothetical protein
MLPSQAFSMQPMHESLGHMPNALQKHSPFPVFCKKSFFHEILLEILTKI